LIRAAVKYGGGGDQVAAGAGVGVDQIGENSPPTEGLPNIEASQDYEDLLAVFRDVLGQRMEQIQQAFEEGNADRLRVLVHKLKGSSGCYGFTGLAASLSECESALRSGQVIESVASELEEVSRLVEIVRRGGGDAVE
jgi:HPt (histidine-containing phosphotransfer) domain-containing protein